MKLIKAILLALGVPLAAAAAEPVNIDYSASVIANASTGSFAPYMIGSWNSGRIVNGQGIWQDGYVAKHIDKTRRYSWGAGVEYIAGYGSEVEYDRYDGNGAWSTVGRRQSSLRLIQLYAEVKHRSVFLSVGMKERGSNIVDDALSSGDLARSNNARPIPGVMAGFIEYQDIPFTQGWVQINGELMWGRLFGNGVADKCFNRYTGVYGQNLWYHYKYCFLRSKPTERLCVTAGVQESAMFGGSSYLYWKGHLHEEDHRGFHLSNLWHTFFPEHKNGEGNAIGNSMGCWSMNARYLFKNNTTLEFYLEWPFEDGSGIAKRTGFDGLWGLQFTMPDFAPVHRIVVEYLDFTNQGGPIHHQNHDFSNSNLHVNIGGADDYYNNDRYGPFVSYGMAIGSAFLKAPIYYTDGVWCFRNNRCRGMHAALTGAIIPTLDYTLKFSAQKAWGSGRIPAAHGLENYSTSLTLDWKSQDIRGLGLKLDLAFDAGKLRGNNFGAMLTASWSGNLKIGK